ncbi:MAG: hypothetical protein JNJ46_11360 [Myxococcales bacterium]|nr:hypothetical protein [Myxococcales bacterium]
MSTKLIALASLLTVGVGAVAQAAEPDPADKKEEKRSDKPVEKKSDTKTAAPAGGDRK